MGNRVVIALGGNALGNNLQEQRLAVRNTAKVIIDLIEAGHEVIVSHGNGPQVGMIQKAMTALHDGDPETYDPCPLAVCCAMSQGYIGHDLQIAFQDELCNRGLDKKVSTVLTHVVVDRGDPAFQNPTKPIGAYVTQETADRLTAERGFLYKEDAGRGLRRVVPSPRPVSIVELDAIRDLLSAGRLVIACGGGGISVAQNPDGSLEDVDAIIDKDFASCRLAQDLDADFLVILTAVEKVAIHFGTPEQTWLDSLSPEEAKAYAAEGHFAPGSMLPKVEAAIDFAQSSQGRSALITLLEKAGEGLAGKTGTVIRS